MNWADFSILSIIGISALISLFRGFVREALSVVGLTAAIWVAVTFYNQASDLLVNVISLPTGRRVIAFVALIVVSLLIAGLILPLTACSSGTSEGSGESTGDSAGTSEETAETSEETQN